MKEKDSENLEKESSDPKIICSACQKSIYSTLATKQDDSN